ncbi:MAG TPA: alkaline phosphatase PhoX, partial [Thermoleophilaceae bacterium]|nr:alkaline phosphatase PhoX [Thermoleophilaceae bacterium]
MLNRRSFIQSGLAAGTALAFGPAFWREALEASADPARIGNGPYGPLGAPDANGIRLPQGFSSRVIARAGQSVEGTGYAWPSFPDGGASFATADGGWILVINSESPPDAELPIETATGGASAIRFRANGEIEAAYRILGGTSTNCAGGKTPWGTWLSCEEHREGQVWECDPTGQRNAVARPALGVFSHEAACVDDVGRHVYLTEDEMDGLFYRFTPARYPDLSAGRLEAAIVARDGSVRWAPVPDPSAAGPPTRQQVPGGTQFRRAEGIWSDSGFVYIATTADHKVHRYNTVLEQLDLVYDGSALGRDAPLRQVDNVTAAPSGDVFVCEDTGESDPLDIGIITPEGEVTRFLKVTGTQHTGGGGAISSELTGVNFDPSGTRMYFSSQRGFGMGVTYEITGPFRTQRVDPRPPGLRVQVPSRIGMRTFLRRGVPVSGLVDEPAQMFVSVSWVPP